MRLIAALAVASVLVPAGVVAASGGGIDNDVPPIHVPGARVVDIRRTDGSLHRYTTLPTTSVFTTYGSVECSFTATGSGTASDGSTYTAGQVVYSRRWLFVEGLPESIGEPNPFDPNSGSGPLSTAVRYFIVFCDSYTHPVRLITVTSRDPMLDPRTQLTTLHNGLQLIPPQLVDDPVVARWDSLVTRQPTWLAVQPRAWTPQSSNATYWRGWTMYLLVTPRDLSFLVDYRPSAESSAAGIAEWTEVVTCVAVGEVMEASTVRAPRRPALETPQPPGVNGPCRVTPPGPGELRVTPLQSYGVVFWANGYTESLAPYWWAGPTAVRQVGNLSSVNLSD